MLTPRRQEILEAYYASKTFKEAGERLKISHQRVEQVVKEHEQTTGIKIPRSIRRGLRTTWRCTGCGETREVVPHRLPKGQCCLRCTNTTRSPRAETTEFATRVINKHLAGDSWYRIALDEQRPWHSVVESVYRYLRTTKQHALMAQIFPTTPKWLRNKIS